MDRQIWYSPEMEDSFKSSWYPDRDGSFRIQTGFVYLARQKEMGSTVSWQLPYSDHSPIPLMTDINFNGGGNWWAGHKTIGADYGGSITGTPDISHSVWPDGHVETRTFMSICTKNYSYGVCGQWTW